MSIPMSEHNNLHKKVRDSSPGDDTIVYFMLKNASGFSCINYTSVDALLTGRMLPSCEKTATIGPLPKKNNSYIPISLVLPVLGKVMDKIIL